MEGGALVKAIGGFVSEAESVDDVVAALEALRSAAFSDPRRNQDASSSRIGAIVKLADACKEGKIDLLHKSDLFGAVSKLLLYKVAPDWLGRFTQTQRELLFDAFFLKACPSEAVLSLVPALIAENDSDDEPASVLIHAERLLSKFLISNSGLKSIAEEFGQTFDLKQGSKIKQVAQIVASIPDRVRPKATSSLTTPLFVVSAISQLLSAANDRWEPSINLSIDGTFMFIGEVFCKLCRRGHADVIAKNLVPAFIDFHTSRKQSMDNQLNESTHWQALVLCMKDCYAVERLTEATLFALARHSLLESDAYHILYSLFGNPVSQTSVRTLFADRFLLWKVFPLRVLRWILDFSVLCTYSKEKIIQKDTVKSLAQTWAERNFIQSASVEQQTYVTAALGICVKAMTREEISQTENLLKCLLEGVSKRLDSPLQLIRRTARQIALTFSVVVNPENPLFLDESDSVEDLGNWDVSGFLQGPSQEYSVHEPEGDERHKEDASTYNDPDSVISSNEVQVDELSESDEALKPYDMSDDESDLDKAKYPSQLRVCASNLRKSDDPNTVERALEICEKLIRLRPDELDNSAADLAHALVHMKNVAVEGEEDEAELRRQRSLVALLVCAPLTTAEVLTRELYSVHVDISQRLMILDVLAEAAQELASGVEPSKTDGGSLQNAGPWKEIFRPFPGNSLITWGETYERELPPKPGQKEVGRSRRWGNRSLQLQKERWTGGDAKISRRNNFVPVAAAMMLPVMRDYDKKWQGLDLLGSDFIVLSRLIQMLGTCMDCLLYQTESASLGTGLLDMLRTRAICKHPESYVRRSVLFAASRVLAALHPSHLASMDETIVEGLEWIREWSLEVAGNDSDEECVRMAIACLHIHSELAFQTTRSLESSSSSNSLIMPAARSSRTPLIVPL